jgi:protein-tyrosine phosphatase
LDSDLTILTSSFVDDLLSAVRESDGDVLFHCVVGSSRSVAVCCAVLARLLEQPWQRVYEKICDQRSCVSINKRFAADLDALA